METSEQILLAASELFALRGYHKVTVASICRKVGINVASVSYHFGGKQNLYARYGGICMRSRRRFYSP